MIIIVISMILYSLSKINYVAVLSGRCGSRHSMGTLDKSIPSYLSSPFVCNLIQCHCC